MELEKMIETAKRITQSRTQGLDGAVCFTQNKIATPSLLMKLVKTDRLVEFASITVEVPYLVPLSALVSYLNDTPVCNMTEDDFYESMAYYYEENEEIGEAWAKDVIDVEYFVGEGEGVCFIPVEGDSFDENLMFPLKNLYYGIIAIPTMYPKEEGFVPFGFPPKGYLDDGVQFLLDQGYLSAVHYKLFPEKD